MNRTALVVAAAAVVAFVAVGGYLVFGRGSGGSGVPVTISATVTGTTMTPDVLSAKQGDRVTMTLTMDRKEEIHLHGYDIKFEARGPADVVTRTFTADKTGSFDIEIEDTGTPLGSFQVTPR
jgi:hypothetical protein